MSSPDPGPTGTAALLFDPEPDLVVAMVGVMDAGMAFLPLDPAAPDDRLEFQLEDAGARVLVTTERYRDRADGLAARLTEPPTVVCLDADAPAADPNGSAAPRTPAPEPVPASAAASLAARPAYLIYTSGSTGTPKGVVVRHHNLAPLLAWNRQRFGLGPTTRVLANLNPVFDFGTWELLATVSSGGTIYFPDPDRRLDLTAHAEAITEHGITMLNTTPSFFAELVALGRPLPSLRIVHLGGEEVTGALVRAAAAVLDPACAIFNGYGPTETTVTCALHEVDRDTPPDAIVPIGTPAANNQLHVVNESLEPVPVGVAGELVVGGDGVSSGYLGRPELTAERFVPNPFGPGRVYRTGDVARYRSDGTLEFLGRLDQQLKLRGVRIEPGEIEATLAAHPAVVAAAVVATDNRLTGYVTPAGAASGDLPGQLTAYLRGTLPDYLVPAVIVVLDALPRTANGKIDRAALPEPVPTDQTAPRDDTEAALVGYFAAALGVDRVGVHDDFFALGGHSLSVTKVVSRVRDELGVELPLYSVFEAPTVARLARVVNGPSDDPDRAGAGTTRGPVPVGANREAELLARIDELSDDEVDALLESMGEEHPA